MAATAAEITSSRMDRRLEEAGVGDQLGGLARTFNAMIERLERPFEEVRRNFKQVFLGLEMLE